ncbi:MAG TPA: HEAT repeat domain-containing protein [Nitrospiraceae bacterium]|nr:HEAT repeat domain-containing protein [Nitrospiraceae bacterium]
MGDPVAEQIAALKDEDWAIREEAATLLGGLKDPRAVCPLVAILRDRDRSVREAAVGALTSIGEPSVVALGDCLADPELSVQEAASAVLASIADGRVLDPLVRALRSQDWIVRMHAAKALGRIKDPKSIQSLIPLLQDKVKAVREETSSTLAAIGEAAIPALLDTLTHQDWLVRLHAVESLGKTKSQKAVEPLLSALFNDGDSAVREDVIRALGEIGDPQAVEFLFTAMKEPGLRTLAVEALGRIGDRRAVPVLIEVVTGMNPPEVARAVAGCGDQWNEEVITQAAAVRALGAIGDESALPALVGALEPTFTRAEAAAALARFGSKVIPLLLPLLAGPRDENVRYHVKETLALVGWRANRL